MKDSVLIDGFAALSGSPTQRSVHHLCNCVRIDIVDPAPKFRLPANDNRSIRPTISIHPRGASAAEAPQ